MVKYKVNLKFKDTFKSLNEIITGILKIELQKKTDIVCNILKRGLSCNYTNYSQKEGGIN